MEISLVNVVTKRVAFNQFSELLCLNFMKNNLHKIILLTKRYIVVWQIQFPLTLKEEKKVMSFSRNLSGILDIDTLKQ